MADKVRSRPESLGDPAPYLLKDMGNGTWAEVVYVDGVSVTAGDVVDRPIQGVEAIAQHDTNTVSAGRQFLVNCTGAGNMKIKFADDSLLTIPINVGLSILPWAVIQVFSTGTTATATFYNLV